MEWIGIVLAVLVAVVGWLRSTYQISKKSGYNERRFEDMDKKLETHTKYHGEHFAAIGDLQTAAAALGQRVADRHVSDTSRFDQITISLAVIQEDIKKLLRRNGGE